MSSETSTEPESLQPWQLFTLAGLAGATIVVFMSRGQSPAAVILLSLTIFTAAGVGLAAWRTFAPISASDEPTGSPIVGGRTRAALEREKALALRSLKELEFDRAMGKVSEKDFAEMGARLRARAAGLMRQLDAGEGYRDMIEKELASRHGDTGSRGRNRPSPAARPRIAARASGRRRRIPSRRPSCADRAAPPMKPTRSSASTAGPVWSLLNDVDFGLRTPVFAALSRLLGLGRLGLGPCRCARLASRRAHS